MGAFSPLRWLVRMRRHPSALLLGVQLLGVMLYPVMEQAAAGRALFGAFGIVVLLLAVWVVKRSPAVGWVAWGLAMPAVILMSVWQSVGYSMVIFLAGLQGIPQHLYDAAAVDGASPWQRFWRITLPLLSPTTFFIVVMAIISTFQVFGQVYMLTGGGPAFATSTIVYYIYERAFLALHMGYASALAWLLFAAIFGLTVIQLRLQRRWVAYE